MPLEIQPSVQNADWAHQWWLDRHQQKLEEITQRKDEINLVFIGDSIVHAWEDLGENVWQQFYARHNPLNLGFAGDRTENVLWRLNNGQLSGLDPKLLVVMIGTNNIGHRSDPPEHTALGVKTILETLRRELPNSKILLLAIFPRGKDKSDKMRLLVNETNSLLKHFADQKWIHWLDINSAFLNDKGEIEKSVMEDYLHPNKPQYKVWAEAMDFTLTSLMEK